MIAITTSSSISVNADRRSKRVAIDPSPDNVAVEDEAVPVSPSALGRPGEADRTKDGHTPPSREGRSAARMTKEFGGRSGLANADVRRRYGEVQRFLPRIWARQGRTELKW